MCCSILMSLQRYVISYNRIFRNIQLILFGQKVSQIDSQLDRQLVRQIIRLLYRQLDIQIVRYIDSQIDSQIVRQIDILFYTYEPIEICHSYHIIVYSGIFTLHYLDTKIVNQIDSYIVRQLDIYIQIDRYLDQTGEIK